mmetsp:Transcript_26959/g.50326  ORF Transcript_26959/g.50326 Transcript_26959/m.50326 type:complete len:99 (+) Transcript_26959:337-633(+)
MKAAQAKVEEEAKKNQALAEKNAAMVREIEELKRQLKAKSTEAFGLEQQLVRTKGDLKKVITGQMDERRKTVCHGSECRLRHKDTGLCLTSHRGHNYP